MRKKKKGNTEDNNKRIKKNERKEWKNLGKK